MIHKIHESLVGLALPLDSLVPLPGNPRVGNVAAIAASYEQFGQLKAIVVKPNGDDTYTVIAGNHQVEACRRLGWTHIAAVQNDTDDETAIAFALYDNRVADLGHTDNEALHAMLNEVVDIYPTLFDQVGWDDFEMAAMDMAIDSVTTEVGNGASGGYVAPTLLSRPGEPIIAPEIRVGATEDDEAQFVAPAGIDQRAAVVGGSPTTGQAGTGRTSFQYTLVFDDSDQMKRWYDFLRILRADAGYEGDTIAAKMISFIDAHSEA